MGYYNLLEAVQFYYATTFTLEEVWKFINGVRADYRNYYLVRFFTGMRTSEIDGLTWDNVDFNRREIVIKQALVKGKIVPPKTQESYCSGIIKLDSF